MGGLIFCLGAFWRSRPGGLLWGLALAACLAAGAAALGGPARGVYQGLIDVGLYGRLLTGLVCLLSLLTLMILRRYAAQHGFAGDELYGLLLLAALGMVLTAGAVHWLAFFLGLELLSICLYVLIAMQRGSDASLEAGLKYFILGAVASALVIFGIAMLYAAGGSLTISASLAPAQGQGQGALVLLGLGLILAGLAFKTSLAPVHVWTPDVYQGAPAPITAFLAAGSKTAVMAALIRLCALLPGDLWPYWLLALWLLAALTMVVTNLSALRQKRVKRLLAYSSAAQMGYVIMALVGAGSGGLSAALFFLAVYGLMDLGVFGLIAMLSRGGDDPDRIQDLRGLARRHPWLAGFMVLCLFSLAGMPPTAGFMGKLLLFMAVLEAGHAVLALVGVISAALAIYYYYKVAAAMYMDRPEKGPALAGYDGRFRPAEAAALGFIAAGLLGLGLFPAWFHGLARAAIATLGV